jgi:uncharacterized protein (TIGR01244 family)
MDDPAGVINWRRLDQRLTTSGQPGESDLARLAAMGVKTVINLGLHTHERALPDEHGSVVALGMAYVHIPVPFDAPDESHFAAFCAAMADAADHPVHVHCIMNYRVSAFIYRWRRDVLGRDEGEARAAMLDVWDPASLPAWAEFTL